MRTAAEIIEQIFKDAPQNAQIGILYVRAINEARIEAIKECAEKAELHKVGNARKDMPTGSQWKSETVYVPVYEVNKQSILKLIDGVK